MFWKTDNYYLLKFFSLDMLKNLTQKNESYEQNI